MLAVKLTTISLLIAAVALVVVFRTLRRIGRDQLGIRPGLLWVGLWSAVGYFALFPSHLDAGLALAQMENRMFFITVIGLFLLFTRVFAQESEIDRLKREIAHLVQELALTRAEQKNTRRE